MRMDHNETKQERYKVTIVWKNVGIMTVLHLSSLYAIILMPRIMWPTILWNAAYTLFAGLGITAGAHRLWTHRTYKARLPLRIFLALANSAALQNSILEWSRDHRCHHKYSETNADPHNATRGFFFSHMGWLLVRKHPDVINKGKTIDLGDLYRDPVVMTQHKYYIPSILTMMLVFPTAVPVFCWGESFIMSYLACLLRYVVSLHGTWLVNSAAHLWGNNRPYDKHINPVENSFVCFFALGEGFHNFHHTFPFDYATSEFGTKLNFTTKFINKMAAIGQACDLRTTPPHVIEARMKRTGMPRT